MKINYKLKVKGIMSAIKPGIDFFKIGLNNKSSRATLKYSSQKHAGSIVESIIRKQGHNISKLARYMKISRCTLYNWFEHDTLPFDILVRIGSYINYDFSSDFPEVFCPNTDAQLAPSPLENQFTENEKIDYWIRKYILLLEKYNECLVNQNHSQQSK
ncbi:helix-turn-helix domain-containing protein [Sphingobacterium yanglingense]|uniref:Bacteriophage CI repressor N-terminal domain-containing protein n=1 Tax=Sphingobacterium yanglingense TaxID=1437280 RepID=A0A4R6WG74_9SPHI|nr:helix-turn-helix domain-containing protein [Sphingobacterium yanglingense]TDQ76386.1 hypothetical protein CLV99_2973 [Sphingobacterium yanglingense]